MDGGGWVFSVYGTPLSAVPLFKYLGRIFSSSVDNWLSVKQNLRRAWGKWGRLAKILVREISDRRKTGHFYVAVFQAVLLFGSETWLLAPV